MSARTILMPRHETDTAPLSSSRKGRINYNNWILCLWSDNNASTISAYSGLYQNICQGILTSDALSLDKSGTAHVAFSNSLLISLRISNHPIYFGPAFIVTPSVTDT